MAGADVRDRMFTASKKVFSREGYRKATVADIVSEAGIARATFYRYFPSKHEVFFELFRDMLGNLHEDARNFFLREMRDEKEWESTLREGLSTFYRFFLENMDIIQAYYSEASMSDPKLYALWDDFERRMISLFTQILDSGVERGAFRPMDTNLVANILLMIFLGVPNLYIMTGGRPDIDIESIAHEMVKLASEGMVARTYRT